MRTYELNQQARFDAVFKVNDGTAFALADPVAQSARTRNPLGVEASCSVVKDAVGKWHALVDCDVPGVWEFRWDVTAPFESAEEEVFYVSDTNFSTP